MFGFAFEILLSMSSLTPFKSSSIDGNNYSYWAQAMGVGKIMRITIKETDETSKFDGLEA